MKYISQINGFWNWRMLKCVSHAEVDLYFAILHCANKVTWKQPFNIPNLILCNLSGISDASQLNKIRNRLIQLGLIKYSKGKKGNAGTYSIIKLYDEKDSENDIDVKYDNNTDNNQNNNTYNNSAAIPTTYIDIDKEKEQEKDITPLSPFSGKLGDAFELWLNYKKEKRQGYKPIALKALISKIERQVAETGEDTVITAINTSIENNWQGLFFDKAKNKDTADDDYFLRVARGEDA